MTTTYVLPQQEIHCKSYHFRDLTVTILHLLVYLCSSQPGSNKAKFRSYFLLRKTAEYEISISLVIY